MRCEMLQREGERGGLRVRVASVEVVDMMMTPPHPSFASLPLLRLPHPPCPTRSPATPSHVRDRWLESCVRTSLV